MLNHGQHRFPPNRPRDYPVERPFHVFGPSRLDSNASPFPSSLSEEHRFTLMGLRQDNTAIRPERSHGDAGKPGPGTDIKNRNGFRRQMDRKKQRLAVVPDDRFLEVADRREVQNPVPAHQKLIVSGKRCDLADGKGADGREVPG